MTGWRVGFVATTEPETIRQMIKIQQYTLACPTSISQYAALEAYTGPQDSVKIMKNEYEKRRNLIYDGLTDLGIPVNCPDGAFYIFPKIDTELLSKIINAGVIVTPGSAFGSAGNGYARMSLCYVSEKYSRST